MKTNELQIAKEVLHYHLRKSIKIKNTEGQEKEENLSFK